MQRALLIVGVLVIIAGLLWPWLSRLPLGRLPGDIAIKRGNVHFYFPVTTMAIVSVVLSVILWLFRR